MTVIYALWLHVCFGTCSLFIYSTYPTMRECQAASWQLYLRERGYVAIVDCVGYNME